MSGRDPVILPVENRIVMQSRVSFTYKALKMRLRALTGIAHTRFVIKTSQRCQVFMAEPVE
jgi:hypothetical protein